MLGTSHKGIEGQQKCSFAKGTQAAICFQFGNANENTVSFFAKKFEEAEESKKLHFFLAVMGASYFQKCCQGEKILATLHKINPRTYFGCGLVKLAPDLSDGPLKGEPNLKYPQIDVTIHGYLKTFSTSNYLENEREIAFRQFTTLATLDQSSNEHQILRETFNDPFAISTVKLLQLAHQQHQKAGLPGIGFLMFDKRRFQEAEKMPEIARNLYFSHLDNLNIRHLQELSKSQWEVARLDLGQENDNSSYVYMTPGIVCSLDGAFNKRPSYKGIGTLIISTQHHASLISDNMMMMNGGFGSRLNQAKFDEILARDWKVFERSSLHSFDFSMSEKIGPFDSIFLEGFNWKSDIRQEHKSYWDTVADPVDVITGAFYVDEIDLSMPGPFSLELRRNYNSQNLIPGILGNGWKLNLNPFLHQEEDKLYAAEEDGSILVYRRNSQSDVWEVLPDDNPELRNFSRKGIGGPSNSFHAYIEANSNGYVLYGADGSKRIFEGFFLKEWIDHAGRKLRFFYDRDQLIRIESSLGSFLGFHYDHRGKIVEAYAKDGRRVHYRYNSQEDLTQVILPNGAAMTYEYDRFHRIIRETKPHGRILENIYDDLGRVIEQRSPAGCGQQMTSTAFFSYREGSTEVKDASGASTRYLIYENYLYEIIDPLGHRTLQSWFIDHEHWFDAEERTLKKWNQPGAWPRSLKSTKDKRGLVTEYFYDDRGNPAEIRLLGEDLTGEGGTEISKRFCYNAHNLCTLEETCGKKTETVYDQTFAYLPKKVEAKIGNTLLSSIEYDYSPAGLVEKENRSGKITHWIYDDRGFPIRSIQKTGTEDPDLVTVYSYNDQGQCIKKQDSDGIYTYEFDIMGNNLAARESDLTGKNISTLYRGYDLNGELIWQQGPDPKNTRFLDYNAQGLVKAKRQTLTHANLNTFEIEPDGIAYTLYDYDPRGHLILETDPMGCSIAREYDSLGRNCSETTHGLTNLFEYEPGGLLCKTVSAKGAVTAYQYTSNGLLKKEIFGSMGVQLPYKKISYQNISLALYFKTAKSILIFQILIK